jgi:glutaredoxin-dependent peroxiredoxin
MAIEVGKKAPDFVLFSDEKKEVKLSDYKGHNVVINFFPAAFTGVCTNQLCDARDNMKKYESLNAKVLGISVDSLFTLEKFKADNNYNFTFLSDFNKVVSKKYDAFYKDFVLGMKGVSKRAIFVVDAKGIVRYAEVLANAGELPNFVAVRETLATLK